MRLLHPFLAAMIASVLVVSPAFGESESELMNKAQTALIRGDLVTAKSEFETVLRLNPRNTTAINYLRTINAKLKQQGAGNESEKQMAGLVMPKVELREATLESVLTYLSQVAVKHSEGRIKPNFVVLLSEEQKNVRVTLSLTGVPFTEILRYIGEQAGCTFTYEKYAIVVKPKPGAAPVGASGSGPSAPAPQ